MITWYKKYKGEKGDAGKKHYTQRKKTQHQRAKKYVERPKKKSSTDNPEVMKNKDRWREKRGQRGKASREEEGDNREAEERNRWWQRRGR